MVVAVVGGGRRGHPCGQVASVTRRQLGGGRLERGARQSCDGSPRGSPRASPRKMLTNDKTSTLGALNIPCEIKTGLINGRREGGSTGGDPFPAKASDNDSEHRIRKIVRCDAATEGTGKPPSNGDTPEGGGVGAVVFNRWLAGTRGPVRCPTWVRDSLGKRKQRRKTTTKTNKQTTRHQKHRGGDRKTTGQRRPRTRRQTLAAGTREPRCHLPGWIESREMTGVTERSGKRPFMPGPKATPSKSEQQVRGVNIGWERGGPPCGRRSR